MLGWCEHFVSQSSVHRSYPALLFCSSLLNKKWDVVNYGSMDHFECAKTLNSSALIDFKLKVADGPFALSPVPLPLLFPYSIQRNTL